MALGGPEDGPQGFEHARHADYQQGCIPSRLFILFPFFLLNKIFN